MDTKQQIEDYSARLLGERYRLISKIGTGGMSTVYTAMDTLLENKKIAVKILHSELAEDSEFIKNFFREVSILQSLNHSNVVRIFDVGMDKNIYFYTMEHIEGLMLDDYTHENEIDIYELSNLIIQISKGLEAIHKKGVVHRDLKPANIIVTKTGEVKIADFGIASLISNGNTINRDLSGTVDYLSPEICMGNMITPASDFYSFGIMLYHIAAGVHPFEISTSISLYWKHVNETPKSVVNIIPDTPIWLSNLIDNLIQKDPDKRPKTAREIIVTVRKNIFGDERLQDSGPHNKQVELEREKNIYDSNIFEIKSNSKLSRMLQDLPKIKKQKKINARKVLTFVAVLILLLASSFTVALLDFVKGCDTFSTPTVVISNNK